MLWAVIWSVGLAVGFAVSVCGAFTSIDVGVIANYYTDDSEKTGTILFIMGLIIMIGTGIILITLY